MEICGQYRAKFGAVPIWHESYGVIWLDLTAKKIITYDPTTEKEAVYDALGWIRSIIPTVDGQFIGVYKDGLYFLNFKLGTKRPFVAPTTISDIYYLNDAKCGPDGQIWAGQSDSFFKKFKETKQTVFSNYPFTNAKLFTVSSNGHLDVKLDHIGVSNGLDWDEKSDKFYHIDAAKQSIFQYHYTVNGKLQFEKLVYTFQLEEGFPNGLTVDSRGFIYTTLFKANKIAVKSEEPTKVVCIDPQTGQIVEQYTIPVSHVTSCTFGGKQFQTLYVTTAYEPLTEARVKEEPYAGYLLKIELQHKGLQSHSFNTLNINVKR